MRLSRTKLLLLPVLAIVVVYFYHSKVTPGQRTAPEEKVVRNVTRPPEPLPKESPKDSPVEAKAQKPQDSLSYRKNEVESLLEKFDALSREFKGSELDLKRLDLMNRYFPGMSTAEICNVVDNLQDDYSEESIDILAASAEYAYADALKTDDPAVPFVLEWIAKQENPLLRKLLFGGMANHTRYSSKEEIDAILTHIPDDKDKDAFCALLMDSPRGPTTKPIDSGFTDILNLATQCGDGSALANKIAERDFSGEFDFSGVFASSNEAAGKASPLVLGALFSKWISADRDAALRLLDGQTSSVVVNSSAQYIASHPASNHILEASIQVDPSGSKVKPILEEAARISPANTWEAAVKTAEIRNNRELLNLVYKQWSATDPEAANKAWGEVFDDQ